MKGNRILSAALCLCLLTGCSVWQSGRSAQAYQQVSTPSAQEVQRPYEAVELRGDYESLPSDACRSLYEALLGAVYEIAETPDPDENAAYPVREVTVSGMFSEADLRQTIMALRNDNPEIFWIASGYQYSFHGGSTTVQLFSYLNAADCASVSAALEQTAEELLAVLPAGLSELDREIAVFDALADRCSYDQAAAADPGIWRSYTAVGALLEGKAVCDGYARAMQLLAAKAGLSTRLVYGSSKGDNHIWNLIRLEGEWYHFDPTWIDGSDIRCFDAFNVTDEVIKLDHKISPVDGTYENCNLPLPVCTATDQNYFTAKGIYIGGFGGGYEEQAVEALVETAREGQPELALSIDPSMDFETTVGQLFSSEPYAFQSWVAEANRRLPSGIQINYGSIRYIPFAAAGGVSLQLSYSG